MNSDLIKMVDKLSHGMITKSRNFNNFVSIDSLKCLQISKISPVRC